MSKLVYGSAPENLGQYLIYAPEMMYYLYLPIKLSGITKYNIEKRLEPFRQLINASIYHFNNQRIDSYNHYNIYLTVKTMYVSKDSPGNREGWHADGFGSNGDINYIWANMNPTDFAIQEFKDISTDDQKSLEQFNEQFNGKVTQYPNGSLLCLDESVVHRVSKNVDSGIRTFVKISFSKHKFNNQGNSKNYLLNYDWQMIDRKEDRNLDSQELKNPSIS